MLKRLREWLDRKWVEIDPNLAKDYMVTFNTVHGQKVLRHLLDTIYYQVYDGKDPIESTILNARRSVIHEILINIDVAENPRKYDTRTAEQSLEELLHGSSES